MNRTIKFTVTVTGGENEYWEDNPHAIQMCKDIEMCLDEYLSLNTTVVVKSESFDYPEYFTKDEYSVEYEKTYFLARGLGCFPDEDNVALKLREIVSENENKDN